MIVYVLTIAWDHRAESGSEVHGVFSTPEAAKVKAAELNPKLNEWTADPNCAVEGVLDSVVTDYNGYTCATITPHAVQ